MTAEKTCPTCKKVFLTAKSTKKYCCDKCRNAAKYASAKAKASGVPKKPGPKPMPLFCPRCAKPIWHPKYGQTLCDACTPPKRSRSKRPPSLSAVAALARAQHLTYGQYMARIQIGGANP